MFAFGRKGKCRKAANALGPHIHHQIVKAMEVRGDVFSSPEELAFTAGYLRTLMWDTLDKRNCKEMDFQTEMLKYVCDRVIPQRLWEVVERGEALGESFFDDSKPEYASAKEAHEPGKDCGIYDGTQLDDSGSLPDNLRRFLVKETLNQFQ